MCQMPGSASNAARELAQSAPIHNPLWSTGQAIFSYYKGRLPAVDPTFSDKTKLKVRQRGRSRWVHAQRFIKVCLQRLQICK
jgi:hypothetical protein